MKVILVSDTHLDRHSNYPGKLMSDLAALKKVYAYAVDHGINMVFNLGDIFEKNNKIDAAIYGNVFDTVARYYHEYSIITVIVPGNHDMYNRNNFNECVLRPFGSCFESEQDIYRYKSLQSNMVAWKPTILTVGSCKVALIPYSDDSKQTESWLEQIGRVDYVFGHFSVKGLAEHIDNAILPDKVNVGLFKKAFLGHYHKRVDAGPYCHIGAMSQRNFGEEGNPTGFTVLDIDGSIGPAYIHYDIEGLMKFKTAGIKNQEEYVMFKDMVNKGKFKDYFMRVVYGTSSKKVTRNFDKEIDFSLDKKSDRTSYDIDSDIKALMKDYADTHCQLKNLDKVLARGYQMLEEVNNG